ncbi:MAG TPA: acetate kinase [Bacteroidales bacterium]|nr:acetate kinase [Bacteroidales bacterium]HPS16022.1 acetate kinase [Bacteroidales bacterium]
MKILVLNCGSSSIKYQLLDMANNADVLAKGLLERVGINDSVLKHQAKGKDVYVLVQDVPNHEIGVELILKTLLHPEFGVIKDSKEINAVGHRVVHGGEKFSGSVLITQEIIDKMEECVDLAPLHNPANLKGIYAMRKLLPEVPMCGIFDTAFHMTMPDFVYMYGLPYEMYDKYKVRRYGFHGTSHRFVSQKACETLKVKYENQKIITCHLGNGASIAAIKDGKSFDTSMGLTPVEGLIMGTRCGDLDLGAFLFIMEKENMDIKKANNYINKVSGMIGISGISSDMRDIWKAADEGNKRAKLAMDMYIYRVKKYVGAYAAAMGGVDIIIFTGGIGENDFHVRAGVCKEMEYMGLVFDTEKNNNLRGKDAILTKPESKVKVMTICTNEELVIALDTIDIILKK